VHEEELSGIYAIEPTPTLIGAVAEHRFIVGPHELHQIITALAAKLLVGSSPSEVSSWVREVIADLMANRGHVSVRIGPGQPPEAHALVHAMNEALGARANTFDLIVPVAHAVSGHETSLANHVQDMQGGIIR
jgi:hypothetical protein